jgi:ABC-type Zn uptake system ZnuABC Zn-binding protein ZnuA
MMITKPKLLILLVAIHSFTLCQSAFSLSPSPVIGVTHPQVEQLINKISSLYKINLRSKMAFSMKGSAHSFRPSMKDLKNIMAQDFLIAGPTGHQKWLKKANKYFPPNTYSLLANSQQHFWLNQELGCKAEQEILHTLKKWNLFTVQENQNEDQWCQLLIKQTTLLKATLEENKITRVILAHGALRLLLENLGLKVLVLFKDDHHSEITSGKLKKALNWHRQSEGKGEELTLQITEPEIKWPSPLKKKGKGLMTISWSPLANDSFDQLNKKLLLTFGKKQ